MCPRGGGGFGILVLKRVFYSIQVAESGQCLGLCSSWALSSALPNIPCETRGSLGLGRELGVSNKILALSSVVLPFGVTAGQARGLDPFGIHGERLGEAQVGVNLGITGFPRPQLSSGAVV